MAFNAATMKELFQEFSTSLYAKLDEMHQQVIDLNTRIHDIEQAHIQGGHIMDEHQGSTTRLPWRSSRLR
jgi:hypothetical protein